MVTPVTRRFQILVAAAVVVGIVLFAMVFLISPPSDLQPTSDPVEASDDVMSRPSGVTPGNGEDFKPKW